MCLDKILPLALSPCSRDKILTQIYNSSSKQYTHLPVPHLRATRFIRISQKRLFNILKLRLNTKLRTIKSAERLFSERHKDREKVFYADTYTSMLCYVLTIGMFALF